MTTQSAQPPKPSSLLRYLPAIYQEDESLGRFLQAFETVLLAGEGDDEILSKVGKRTALDELEKIKGLEKKIASLSGYLDPRQTLETFLPWLASWTGFALRADLPPERKRDFIASAIGLYRMRGTKANMIQMLEVFTSREAKVKDDPPRPSFHFQVRISFNDSDDITRKRAIAHALIEREKPAHTSYTLNVSFPTMKIGACRVGTKTSYLSGAPEE